MFGDFSDLEAENEEEDSSKAERPGEKRESEEEEAERTNKKQRLNSVMHLKDEIESKPRFEIWNKIMKDKPLMIVGDAMKSQSDDEAKFYAEADKEERSPTKKESIEFYKTKKNYINPQWTAISKLDVAHPTRKMYNHLAMTSTEKDLLVPSGYKLSLNIDKKSTNYLIVSFHFELMTNTKSINLFHSKLFQLCFG